MRESEDEEAARGGAASEHLGDVLHLVGGHPAGGGGSRRSVVHKRVVNVFRYFRGRPRGDAIGFPTGQGGIPSDEESESESEDEEEEESGEPAAVGEAGGGLVGDVVKNDVFGAAHLVCSKRCWMKLLRDAKGGSCWNEGQDNLGLDKRVSTGF